MYEVFKAVGYENAVSLEVNGSEVYYDEEYTENDLRTAIDLALKENPENIYHVQLVLQKVEGDNEEQIDVNMYSQTEKEEKPLVVNVDLNKDVAGTTTFLETLKQVIDEKFGVESGEITVDEEEDLE